MWNGSRDGRWIGHVFDKYRNGRCRIWLSETREWCTVQLRTWQQHLKGLNRRSEIPQADARSRVLGVLRSFFPLSPLPLCFFLRLTYSTCCTYHIPFHGQGLLLPRRSTKQGKGIKMYVNASDPAPWIFKNLKSIKSILEFPTPCKAHHVFWINRCFDLPEPLHISTIHVLQRCAEKRIIRIQSCM
jgi:hypothetical protein